MKKNYALILGASSGFGKAVSLALAKDGVNIIGVHLDRSSTMPDVEKLIEDIQACTDRGYTGMRSGSEILQCECCRCGKKKNDYRRNN